MTGCAVFLARAAQSLPPDGWAFIGFHWPVLASETARRAGWNTIRLFEGGIAASGSTSRVPSSTTDHHALAPAACWHGTSSDVLLSLVQRCEIVVLDAGNVDVRGVVNSTAIGPGPRPRVRLPGGGGSADAAARAQRLLLLYGAEDLSRLQQRVEYRTAVPGPHTRTRIMTRWGDLEAGTEPRLLETVDGPGSDAFVSHAAGLGVNVAEANVALAPPAELVTAAHSVLEDAARCGYRVAARALREAD